MTKAGVVVMGTLKIAGEMAPYPNPNHPLNHNFATLIHYCREGNGTPLQYSCLENPMGRGAW